MKNLKYWHPVFTNNVYFVGYCDGILIQTDEFVEINVKERILYTKTRTYKLGEPDKVWVKHFV